MYVRKCNINTIINQHLNTQEAWRFHDHRQEHLSPSADNTRNAGYKKGLYFIHLTTFPPKVAHNRPFLWSGHLSKCRSNRPPSWPGDTATTPISPCQPRLFLQTWTTLLSWGHQTDWWLHMCWITVFQKYRVLFIISHHLNCFPCNPLLQPYIIYNELSVTLDSLPELRGRRLGEIFRRPIYWNVATVYCSPVCRCEVHTSVCWKENK